MKNSINRIIVTAFIMVGVVNQAQTMSSLLPKPSAAEKVTFNFTNSSSKKLNFNVIWQGSGPCSNPYNFNIDPRSVVTHTTACRVKEVIIREIVIKDGRSSQGPELWRGNLRKRKYTVSDGVNGTIMVQ